MQTRSVALLSIAALITGASAASASPLDSAAEENRIDNTSQIITADLSSDSASTLSEDPIDYWTPERMMEAKPMEVESPKISSVPSKDVSPQHTSEHPTVIDGISPKTHNTALDSDSPPTHNGVSHTVGRLFFTNADGINSLCTATIVVTESRNSIMTGGHCIFTPGKGWHTKFLFAPAYDHGYNPEIGVWEVDSGRTFNDWAKHGSAEHDQAFLEIKEKDGVHISDVAGAAGFAYNLSSHNRTTQIAGFPQFYNGSKSYEGRKCETAASPSGGGFLKAECGMDYGSAGGPWFLDKLHGNRYIVWATTVGLDDSTQPSKATGIANNWLTNKLRTEL